jgi:hypothetical protein
MLLLAPKGQLNRRMARLIAHFNAARESPSETMRRSLGTVPTSDFWSTVSFSHLEPKGHDVAFRPPPNVPSMDSVLPVI